MPTKPLTGDELAQWACTIFDATLSGECRWQRDENKDQLFCQLPADEDLLEVTFTRDCLTLTINPGSKYGKVVSRIEYDFSFEWEIAEKIMLLLDKVEEEAAAKIMQNYQPEEG